MNYSEKVMLVFSYCLKKGGISRLDALLEFGCANIHEILPDIILDITSKGYLFKREGRPGEMNAKYVFLGDRENAEQNHFDGSVDP